MRRVTVLGVLLLLACQLAAAAPPRHEIQFPDIPGYRTLKCDFHIHTVFSDGYVWPTVRVDEAWREGLDVIAITDHIEYLPHKDDIPKNHNRPYELAMERAQQHGIVLIRGAEITRATPPGHFNAIFLKDIDPLDTEDFYQVFDEAQRQQAFTFWNHPGWKGLESGRWGEEHNSIWEQKQLHGIEICNGNSYYEYAHKLAAEKQLTLVGNSDIHEPSLDLTPTAEEHRTLTLVFAKDQSIESVREALFAGRTAVWCQNKLYGRESELAAVFAASVRVNPPHHRSDDRVWLMIDNRCALDIELKRPGAGVLPGSMTLPASAQTLLRITVPADWSPPAERFEVSNMLIGPGAPLSVDLTIPRP
ncbi:MAG: PHP domain-containing protein [Planctomycetota bacterium]